MINIIAVGKIKESYLKDAITEYTMRLSRFVKVATIEIPEADLRKETKGSIELAVSKESQAIQENIKGFVIVLDINGENLSSPMLADRIDKIFSNAHDISLVIGGSHGVSQELKKNADLLLSFGKMTFPHQLMRVILLEQVYRAFCINNNLPYHK